MKATEVRQDISAKHLRERAKKEKNAGVCKRLLGIAHLLEGGSRKEAQRIACLTVNTFRVWLQRFNQQGIEGLKAKKQSGRPAKVSDTIKEALKEKVLSGPMHSEGLVRYRLVDFQAFLQKKYQVNVQLSTLWYVLQTLGFSWKTGRQRHPKSDEAVQVAFKKTSLLR